jgi:hypothetical protein
MILARPGRYIPKKKTKKKTKTNKKRKERKENINKGSL